MRDGAFNWKLHAVACAMHRSNQYAAVSVTSVWRAIAIFQVTVKNLSRIGSDAQFGLATAFGSSILVGGGCARCLPVNTQCPLS
jgi:hypothetical protein